MLNFINLKNFMNSNNKKKVGACKFQCKDIFDADRIYSHIFKFTKTNTCA